MLPWKPWYCKHGNPTKHGNPIKQESINRPLPPHSFCLEAAWCCWLLLLPATLCSSCRSVHCLLFQQLFQFLTVSFIILTHTIIWLLDLPHLTIPTWSTRYTGCVWWRNNLTTMWLGKLTMCSEMLCCFWFWDLNVKQFLLECNACMLAATLIIELMYFEFNANA